MTTATTTRLSSKGQVVIPERIRQELHLRTGTEFVVVGSGDAIVLKTVQPPALRDVSALIRKARRQALQAGLKPADVRAAVARARKCR
jgi:AbrB family looped-hinge helix DNA binding protein